MSARAINTKGATCVVWMIAATDEARAENLLRACAIGAGFPEGLLATWPLLERHFSGAAVGIWVLVAMAEKQSDAQEFIDARHAIEPDCKLEIAHTWPRRPGTTIPQGKGFQVENGWLVVFPSPLMEEAA